MTGPERAELAEGDRVVCIIRRSRCDPWLGHETTVVRITPSLIVTDDGLKWHVDDRSPVKEGRNSGKTLVSVHDTLAVALRAKHELDRVASRANNLRALPRVTPEQVYADLSIVIRAARDARDAVLTMMSEASRAGQSSER